MNYRTPGIFWKEPDNPGFAGNEDDEDADESATGGNRQTSQNDVDEAVQGGSESGKTTIDDLLKGLDETTNGKGVARNFESTGGYDQTLKDFDALNPSNVKDIQTKYGPGKVGTLSDGTKVVARQGSTTGGPTLEIKVSNSKVYKIRY